MIDLLILIVLLFFGYFFGRFFETQHYKSIIQRENETKNIIVVASKIPPIMDKPDASVMVMGSVVISVDFFKRFLASLRSLIGGRVISYESLLDRARREAILRMKLQARGLGANKIFNIKYETASISKNARNGIGSIEVLAYGTAFIPIETPKN
ncbi:hypothetical protein MNBD_GAMMA07-2057 [hydrothermal vent metagenome]|uniref:YbjQ family protein n=1 Tax=hydrothermal vent metagenome TaxID=652676 RepID=A0A3B0WIB3_9ZZZZ